MTPAAAGYGSLRATVLVLGLLVVASAGAASQEPVDADAAGLRVQARVRQVAGATIYVDLGTDHGLQVGDTVAVFREMEGETVGRLTVTVASTVRSVLSFAGTSFAIARGEILVIGLARSPAVAPPALDAPVGPERASVPDPGRDIPGAAGPRRDPAEVAGSSPVAAPSSASRPATTPHGRWGLEMAVSHAASTLGTEVDPVEVSRTYATPGLRFDLRAPGAVGGFDLRLSTRTTYRYGTEPGFDPTWSPRVYEFALERRFESVPVELVLGRFHSPGESFSGYWDGLSLRVGGSDFGVGVLAGLQPDRWNQLPSSELPKTTAFVDFERRRGDVRWRGDVSAHMAWPRDGAPTHTFFGVGQRLSAGPLRLTQELQVDRDPFEGGVRLSRLVAQASLRLSPAVDLRGGVSRRESYLIWAQDVDDLFSSRRDRANVGVSLRRGRGYVAVDLGLNRDVSDHVTRSVTGTASLPQWIGAVGLAVSSSWWEGDTGHALSVAPALTWSAGSARIRAGYRYYVSDTLGRRRTTHAPDLSLQVPFRGGLRASLRLRSRWGEGVRSEFLQIDLTRIF